MSNRGDDTREHTHTRTRGVLDGAVAMGAGVERCCLLSGWVVVGVGDVGEPRDLSLPCSYLQFSSTEISTRALPCRPTRALAALTCIDRLTEVRIRW
jgi:hypothetical protein